LAAISTRGRAQSRDVPAALGTSCTPHRHISVDPASGPRWSNIEGTAPLVQPGCRSNPKPKEVMMSFLDRVTKAVGDVVDRGKQEVDQFMRIQKINGEIGEIEKRVAEFKNQIQQATHQAGEKAIELLRSGALASPELQGFVSQITGFEQEITSEEAAIAGKKKDIEAIKAEHDAEAAAKAASQVAASPAAAGAPSTALPAEAAIAAPAPTGPAPTAPAAGFCTACNEPLTGTSPFCPHCGVKLG
jgi:hypothetical protein